MKKLTNMTREEIVGLEGQCLGDAVKMAFGLSHYTWAYPEMSLERFHQLITPEWADSTVKWPLRSQWLTPALRGIIGARAIHEWREIFNWGETHEERAWAEKQIILWNKWMGGE